MKNEVRAMNGNVVITDEAAISTPLIRGTGRRDIDMGPGLLQIRSILFGPKYTAPLWPTQLTYGP